MTTMDMMMRLGAALATGLLLGLERESHGRAAGLRTTVLVCIAAATAMILSEKLFVESGAATAAGAWRPDPARLGAGLLTGMGFLGGGVIIRQGNLVRGVTTASIIWFATVLGLCFGSGAFILGAIGVAMTGLVLFILPRVEDFVANDWYATLTVTIAADGIPVPALVQVVKAHKIHVKSLELSQDNTAGTRTATLTLKFKRGDLIAIPDRTVADVARQNGVIQASWST